MDNDVIKETDIVLIYVNDNPEGFAKIEEISPDTKLKWFQVKLLLLQVPLMVTTWILKDEYINGDNFTMGGHTICLEKVVCPNHNQKSEIKKKSGKIVPLFKK